MQTELIQTRLKENNLKVTKQRVIIYDYLLNHKTHPTADVIHSDLLPEHPQLSLGTVYKTLATFRDSGLVLEFNAGGDSFHYDADTSEHTHFICKDCNKITDFHFIRLEEDLKQLPELEGYDIDSSHLILFGQCKDCK